MNFDQIIDEVSDLVCKEKYLEAIKRLDKITNLKERKAISFGVLAGLAISRTIEEYGRVKLIEDREEYERIKIGLDSEIPARAVLFLNTKTKIAEEIVEGIEDLVDNTIPENNLLRDYYNTLERISD